MSGTQAERAQTGGSHSPIYSALIVGRFLVFVSIVMFVWAEIRQREDEKNIVPWIDRRPGVHNPFLISGRLPFVGTILGGDKMQLEMRRLSDT